ncbi:hypothetical protein [Lutibacter sp.]|uniref:hypothetical protein n=1 Tax=Lutibacter sp. TaxID=1925666 RepID=UPI0034A0090D
MTKENRRPVKISSQGYTFLDKLIDNRVKFGENRLNFIQTLDLIATYFKNNNDRYLEMLKTKLEGEKKC